MVRLMEANLNMDAVRRPDTHVTTESHIEKIVDSKVEAADTMYLCPLQRLAMVNYSCLTSLCAFAATTCFGRWFRRQLQRRRWSRRRQHPLGNGCYGAGATAEAQESAVWKQLEVMRQSVAALRTRHC